MRFGVGVLLFLCVLCVFCVFWNKEIYLGVHGGGLFDIFSDVTSMMNIAITLKVMHLCVGELSAVF